MPRSLFCVFLLLTPLDGLHVLRVAPLLLKAAQGAGEGFFLCSWVVKDEVSISIPPQRLASKTHPLSG
jgi:hypothetical protein